LLVLVLMSIANLTESEVRDRPIYSRLLTLAVKDADCKLET